MRTKRLHRYYLNGNTAFRLVLYLKPGVASKPTYPPEMLPPEDTPGGGAGLMSEDLVVRQRAQMDVQGASEERRDVIGMTAW